MWGLSVYALRNPSGGVRGPQPLPLRSGAPSVALGAARLYDFLSPAARASRAALYGHAGVALGSPYGLRGRRLSLALAHLSHDFKGLAGLSVGAVALGLAVWRGAG